MVLLMLKKVEEKKTWAYVTEREDKKKKYAADCYCSDRVISISNKNQDKLSIVCRWVVVLSHVRCKFCLYIDIVIEHWHCTAFYCIFY